MAMAARGALDPLTADLRGEITNGPRADFGAKLEPSGRILTGAGQVEPDGVLAYARAQKRTTDPVIFHGLRRCP